MDSTRKKIIAAICGVTSIPQIPQMKKNKITGISNPSIMSHITLTFPFHVEEATGMSQ